MSCDENEILRIRKITSGRSKANARIAIAKSISSYRPEIESAKKSLNQQKEIVALMNQANDQRQLALQSSAGSFCDPAWAAAATVESWLHALLGGDTEEISRVEMLINELENRV